MAKRETLKPTPKGKAVAKTNLPPRPKDGSRKADVFDTYFKDGYDAAVKKAAASGLASGTARSWMSGWAKASGRTLPPISGKEKGTRKPSAPREKIAKTEKKKDKEPDKPYVFQPEYCYPTERKAKIEADHKANRTGMDNRVFFVAELDGKFAVVPLHLKTDIPMPTFSRGDHITNLGIKHSRAVVLDAGPEQSVIRYNKDMPGRHREPCVSNRYLMLMPPPEGKDKKKGKASRERL